ncbi:hypothetical protein L1987_71743 [Smallanthus sonchifolius]|uniref:Uncharacterized protein n=1 Tax=Smallanthus sonchifolius TaxID=185202 RepID=A0ACB9AXL9_9ASTR|nr:hypothetical protein L1987_71743 [Smallanthus sonchifolius]
MGTRLQDLNSHLKIGSGGVRMIGIWGIGGSGKTTLVSSMYMEISQHFEGQCIVDNVREESSKFGLPSLQNKILSTLLKRKVVVQSVMDGQQKIKKMGHPQDERMEIFDACGLHPGIGVKVLMQKGLVTISDGKFDMHDLVQEMGHYIVRGKHPKNPSKHSRVWGEEDIEDMCSREAVMENNKIVAIRFYGESPRFPELVTSLKKLKLLICKCVLRDKYDTKVFEAPTFLSNELPENFQPKKLVILSLHNSLHEEIWKGNKHLPNLKQLNLYDAWNLLSV